MKGASTTFVHWIVFCPRWNQWETFTKLGFDEVIEECCCWVVECCLGVPSDPWEPGLLCRVVLGLEADLSSTVVTSTRMRKESPWLLLSLPLWLRVRQWAWSMPLPQGEGEASTVLCLIQGHLLLSTEHWPSGPPSLKEWETFPWN